MINTLNSMLPPVLLSLENSSFNFYPTGSRYLGGVIEASSDWDFIVEDSSDVRLFLLENGFERNSEDEYAADNTIAAVYTYHGDKLTDKGLTKIDVQVLKPEYMGVKLKIQKILKDHFGLNGLPGDKVTRSQFWHLMFYTFKTLNIA